MIFPIIYINGRFLTHNIAGIPRFSYEMCKAMYKAGINIQVIAPCYLKNQVTYPFPVVYYGDMKSHLWEQVELYRFMKNKKDSLLISFSGLGPALCSNHIMTIHDVSFWRFPEYFSFSYNFIYRILTPFIAKKARKIITVSKFSKKEIMEYLKLPEEKIEIIGNAVPSEWEDIELNADKVSDKKEKYILMVSSRDPRKNFSRALDAFLTLNLHDGIKLYIIGDTGTVFKDSGISKTQHESIKLLGRVSDKELISYYRNALFFIYPSIYEGFGIPPLEAMFNGCPVLASNIEPLKEVCGDAALYCDPLDTNSIADGMNILLKNETLREQLIEQGKVQIRNYNWDLSVRKLKEMIDNL